MNDNLDLRIGDSVRRAYAGESLTPSQRQGHLRRIADARATLDGSRGGLLQMRRLELGVVAAALLIALAGAVTWQLLFAANGDDTLPPETSVPGITPPDETATPLPEPSLPVDIDGLLSLAMPPEPGTAHYLHVEVSSDARLDHGATLAWRVESWDRVLEDGKRQQHATAYDSGGTRIATYIGDGDRWYWDNRGWTETGDSSPMLETPLEIRLAQHEPFNLADLLGREPDDENVSSEDSIVRQYELESIQETGWIAVILGLDRHHHLGEVTLDASGEHVLQSGRVLTGETGERATMNSVTYLAASVLDAGDVDDDLFAIPDLPDQRALQYGISDADELPFGLRLDRHVHAWPDAGEQVVLAADGLQVDIRVTPSLGGLDVQSWERLSLLHYPTLDTGSLAMVETFNVAWRASSAGGPIVTAVGDDGRYRFELRTVPETWGQEELATLMAALSDAGS